MKTVLFLVLKGMNLYYDVIQLGNLEIFSSILKPDIFVTYLLHRLTALPYTFEVG